ncbi:MAG: DUF1989 domain-containing protein, partial [Chloroflexi bacterium]|nr:DUF1989 domain-containing protein [Chloroflexota bacterium]
MTTPSTITIPARKGKAAFVGMGQRIKVINTHGQQVVDTWAFNRADLKEFMSMEHSRTALANIMAKDGESMVTNQRRPILTVLEDTSSGIHDTLMAACDRYRYELLGCAEYHDKRDLGGKPIFTEDEVKIDHDWGTNGPGNGIGNDNFSVRWQGRFTFEKGEYTFTARADDGIRLWVDGESLIDAWRDQAATTYTMGKELPAGQHTLKVEYYEHGGGAVAQVHWEKVVDRVLTPGIPVSPNPQISAELQRAPDALDWADAQRATSYDVYLDGRFVGNVKESRWEPSQPIGPSQYTLDTHTWYVVARNEEGTTRSEPWTFTVASTVITGVPTLEVSISSLDFGEVLIGDTKGLTFTVINTGEGKLTGYVLTDSAFELLGGIFSLSADVTKDVVV